MFQTLNEVLNKSASAPYYLLSYATIIYIYIILSMMYFFFMSRTQVFLSNFVEPSFTFVGFQQYKTNRFVSGKLSSSLTKNTTFVIILLPIVISIFCLVYLFITFHDRFVIEEKNTLVIFWSASNIFLFWIAIRSMINLNAYSQRDDRHKHDDRS